MSIADYCVVLSAITTDEGGGWLAEVPDLPGCMSDGDTREEALANARRAIAQWTACSARLGRPVRSPFPPQQYG